jgi:hypothetical protein
MPADDIPSDVIERIRATDHRKTVALFVFSPELNRVTDEDRGTVASDWYCAALLVYRGRLAHNRLVIGTAEQDDGDSIESVAASFGEFLSRIVREGLGVADE